MSQCLPEMKNKKISYVNLSQQNEKLKIEILKKIDEVLESGNYILGNQVDAFENEFSAFCGTRYSVAVGNGTEALMLSLKALEIGKGDEVITVPNSFLATASAICMVGAKPVFVDVCEDYNINSELIRNKITSNTRAIIPVHLTGRPAAMDQILSIAKKNNLFVIEDAAQAVGAKYNGQKVGSLGITGCFSVHPLKNLNACGDGGIITTNDENIYKYLIKARNHGLTNRDECQFWSLNSRMDAIQAAILRVKLRYLNELTDKRRSIASYYQKELKEYVKVPQEKSCEYAVYHTFIVQAEKRDDLKHYMKSCGIETKIHYPIPIHLQKAAQSLQYKLGDLPIAEKLSKRILSLPIYAELKESQIKYITETVKKFYK